MNVAIIGCGVRGSIVAALLAGAGVEELALVDGASVEQDDIGSHPLQFTPDLHASKSEALVAKLGLINPTVLAQPFPAFVTEHNTAAILSGADCVVDCANDPAISAQIVTVAENMAITVIAPAPDYQAASSNSAIASVVGAQQAADVLALRVAGQSGGTV